MMNTQSHSQKMKNIAAEDSAKYAAQKIRNSIRDWLDPNKRPLGQRKWFWELLQNARDTSKRKDFDVEVLLKEEELIFRHNAGPFEEKELCALLMAGSAKAFEGIDNIGRFGKGFLVTHVISTRVNISGLAVGDSTEGPYPFSVDVDRSGNEEAIQTNIEASFNALDTEPKQVNGNWTTYLFGIEDAEGRNSALVGIKEISRIISFVFAFVPNLLSVTVQVDNAHEPTIWQSDRSTRQSPHWSVRGIRKDGIIVSQVAKQTLSVNGDEVAIEVALQLAGSSESIIIQENIPRIYTGGIPITLSDRITWPFCVSSIHFQVDSDRNEIDVSQDALFRCIERLIPQIVKDTLFFLRSEGIRDLRPLAVARTTGDSSEFLSISRGILKTYCQSLETSPLALDLGGRPTNLNDLSIPSPLFGTEDGITLSIEEVWLLGAISGLPMCKKEEARQWWDLHLEWKQFDVPLGNTYGVHTFLDDLKRYNTLVDLYRDYPTLKTGDDFERFMTLLFKTTSHYETQAGLTPGGKLSGVRLPNQKGDFKKISELHIDSEIDPELKQIATKLGHDIQEKLLHEHITRDENVSQYLSDICACPSFDNQEAFKELLLFVQARVDHKKPNAGSPEFRSGYVRLLFWLSRQPWKEWNIDADMVPLPTEDRFVYVDKPENRVLAPFSTIAVDGIPLSEFWPRSGVLTHRFVELNSSDDDYLKGTLEMLHQLGLVSPAPLDTIVDSLETKELRMLVKTPLCTGHLESSEISLSIIPQLQRILSGIAGSQDPKKAKSFLHFLFSYVLSATKGWHEPVSLQIHSQGHESTIEVYPCLWLAQIKGTKWIPLIKSDGEPPDIVESSKSTLEPLIDQGFYVKGEVREFLSRHFGFSALDLSIRGQSAFLQIDRSFLEDSLVKFIPTLASPEEINTFNELVEKRIQDNLRRERNRKFGFWIQKSVEELFRKRGFKVKPRHVGFDFEVEWDVAQLDIDIESTSSKRHYYVEVKATINDEVGLSRKQATMAVNERDEYIVCIVDAKDFEYLVELANTSVSPDPGQVPLSRILILEKLGSKIKPLVQGLDNLEYSEGIRLTVDARFMLSRKMWEANSNALEEWISRVAQQVSPTDLQP